MTGPPRALEQPVARVEMQQTSPSGSGAPLVAQTVQRDWSFSGAVGAVAGAVGGAVSSVTSGVRDRVLGTVAGWARRMPGYELLCTILGRDVVAGTPVPRSAAAVISGFLALIPGGGTMRQNLQESGAVNRAGAWFDEEIPKLGLTWEAIRGLFQRAWGSLTGTDLLNPAGAWGRISGIFGPPLARLRAFAAAAGSKVLEFIFEGALSMAGSLGSQVMGVVRRAGGVVTQIFRDPIGFAGNLVSAVRGGLGQFVANIAVHLRTGLFGWLMGALRGAVRLPAQFDLRGILGMAMEFLGLTWDYLRSRLVRMIGAPRVALLERGVGIVRDIATRGLSAITDRIASFASGLFDTVIGGIREWVQNSVVVAAVTRIASMLNPVGAVIQAIVGVYNAIKFFLENQARISALANSVFDSIGAIASGSIGAAKNAVERSMGQAVPVALGFFARLMGLGDIATPVRNVITRVRGVIDGALDRVVGWLGGMARRLRGANARGTRESDDTGDLSPAVAAGNALLTAQNATEASVREALPALRRRFALRGAELVPDNRPGSFAIEVQRMSARTSGNVLSDRTLADAETLRELVGARTITTFLETMVRNDRVGQLTWARFSRLWAEHQPSVDFMKREFRRVMPSTHEWVPSNFIPDVLARAISVAGTDKARINAALKWLRLHNELRTPTRGVVLGVQLRPPTGRGRRYTAEFSAHTGAFVDPRDIARAVGTVGQEAFHGGLRQRFLASPSTSPAAYVRQLRVYVADTVWTGNGIPPQLMNEPIGDFGAAYYLNDSDPPVMDATWGEVVAEHKSQRRAMLAYFDDLAGRLGRP